MQYIKQALSPDNDMKFSLYQVAILFRNKYERKGASEPIAWISARVQAIFKSIFI